MQKTTVLVDGFQFLGRSGTGIASYVRTLTGMLRSADCSVGVLFGQRHNSSPKLSPAARGTSLFAEAPPANAMSKAVDLATYAAGLATGRGYRAKAYAIDASHIDLSAIEPALPSSDEIFNADRFFLRANRGFQVSGRFTQLESRPSGRDFDVAHWTAPIPVRMQGVPNIYTLHDLIPLRFPYFTIGNGDRAFQMHEKIARDADHIITVSEASKRDIVELLHVPEERVTVTYQPVPHLPHIDQLTAERLVETIYGVKSKQYALFLGAIEPKKNVKRLIEAFCSANLGIPLLLCGPAGWLCDGEMRLIETLDRAGKVARGDADAPVRQLGYLPRRHVVALMKCAKFFVFPSLYEGFGLPVIEAMQLGVPVLTSNNSSLPEVAGDAAVLINASSTDEMTAGLQLINSDVDLRAELARKGPAQAAKFSVDYCMGFLRQAYQKVGVTLPQPPELHANGSANCQPGRVRFQQAAE